MSNSLVLILLLSLLAIPGCTHPVNARLELGAQSRTPTFEINDNLSPIQAAPTSTPTPRSRWDTTVIIAPIDGIVHGPALRLYAAPRNNDHPRSYGLFPTADSALDHQTHSTAASIRYTRSELVATISSIVDPFLIHSQLTNQHWSPRRVWKRSRQDNAWSSGKPASPIQETNHD